MQTVRALNKWLVLLVRKWLRIENEEHRHWCNTSRECYHRSICWYCTDPFCADVQRKDCPNCVLGLERVCQGKLGERAAICTCGYGRG